MKKAFLILGAQGTGKTKLLDNYLSQFKTTTKAHFDEQENMLWNPFSDAIGVDEVITVKQLKRILDTFGKDRYSLIVCAQLHIEVIPISILSKFDDVIQLTIGLSFELYKFQYTTPHQELIFATCETQARLKIINSNKGDLDNLILLDKI